MQNKYPLWKNITLVLLVLVGLVYAIPNVYTEEPAVQVSSKTPMLPKALKTKIERVLDLAHLKYKNITADTEHLEVRFASTDIQLLARDVIKSSLGPDYTVALNLLPSTPKWLSKIGAEPMKQGLDLRGGVHFLLEVDVDSVLMRRYEGLMKSIGRGLRDAGVRYSGIRYVTAEGVQVRFKTEEQKQKAKAHLKTEFPDLLLTSSSSSPELVLALSDAELSKVRQNTIEQTMSILRNRVNELGVGEAVVQQQGSTRVAVDLPGIQDATRAKQILGGTATLEFHLVDSEHDPVIAKKTGAIPVGTKFYMMEGQPILLMRQVVLSGDSITSAMSSFDQQSATPAVSIQLGGGGESVFTKATRASIGKRMAIVFVESRTSLQTINGETKRVTHHEERVISAPVIQSALGNNFQITGLHDTKEAADLALLLRAGALPAAIYPIEERTVGPTLGQENIHRGMVSLEIGMLLILISMVVYYRLFGWVANVALALNLILLSALLSLLGATLTLPGIAGIVLTVGMAVDANVLIYERIRVRNCGQGYLHRRLFMLGTIALFQPF
jgi:preprotein translocase subunit SecD